MSGKPKKPEGPWFRYRSPFRLFGFRPLWWPTHWKGCLLMLVALPLIVLGFGIAFALANSGYPLIGLLIGAIIAGPIQWIGFQHAESADDPPRPPFRKFRDDE
jgi:hypothetical protein